MTLSSVAQDLFGAKQQASKVVEYRYDLRLEVGVKDGAGTVPLVAIFHDLVKRMKSVVDADKPIAIFTATNKVFQESKEMTSTEFQEAFKVAQNDGKQNKVMLGFKLKTMTSLYEIKQRLMTNYLNPHSLFLREHVGGFDEGIKISSFGFLQGEHPDHPDISHLSERFERLTNAAWKALDKNTKTKWKEDLPEAFPYDRLKFPINFSKERISAESDVHPKVITTALMVTTPKKYGLLLRTLLDQAILDKKIQHLIPLAFSRENSDAYYHLVAAQERFMDQHRNIPISNVPPDFAKIQGSQSNTLEHLLQMNRYIQRVSYDSKTSRVHVSTVAPRYREVHNWIGKHLKEHKFPYQPSIKPLKSTMKDTPMTKYSESLADVISLANDSYDASTVKTQRSNPWKQRPPLDISYTLTDEAFPPLQPPKKDAGATQSTTSETFDEVTIQSAISNAIQTLKEQHQQELAQLRKQFEERLQTMEKQVLDLGQQVVAQTYQALVHEDSPLATKADHMELQFQINTIQSQLSQIIKLVSKPNGSMTYDPSHSPPTEEYSPRIGNKRPNSNLTPEKSPRKDSLADEAAPLSSATSDLDVGMEGCEE